MRRLPVGRAWEALREDEIACRSLGINPTNIKLSAFAIGAMFARLRRLVLRHASGLHQPGELHLHSSRRSSSPSSCSAAWAARSASLPRSCIAIGVPRIVPRARPQYRMLVFGLAMVLIMVWRPRGLSPRATPSVFLNASARPSAAELVKEARSG